MCLAEDFRSIHQAAGAASGSDPLERVRQFAKLSVAGDWSSQLGFWTVQQLVQIHGPLGSFQHISILCFLLFSACNLANGMLLLATPGQNAPPM